MPTIERLKKIYSNIYAFPVAGSIDGIIISRKKLPIFDKKDTLEMILVDKSPEFPLKDKYDYAFLYFESNLKSEQIIYTIEEVNKELAKSEKGIQNYMIFKSRDYANKHLLFIKYRGNVALDRLWELIYEYAREYDGIYNDNTYIVFTTRFARRIKKNVTLSKAYA